VAVRSKVCGRLVDGIVGSNPARGMDVCLLCLYVVLSCRGRGLCDGLITRLEESYRVSNVCVIKKPREGPYIPVGNETKMNLSLLNYENCETLICKHLYCCSVHKVGHG
jgi:hypothetical protein